MATACPQQSHAFPTAAVSPDSAVSAQISALVETYAKLVYRCAYSVLRDSADAEDVVQETFIRVLKHSSEVAQINNIRVWLMRIAWNHARDLLRRRKTRPVGADIEDVANLLASREMSPVEHCIRAGRHAEVLAHLEQLPRKEREVLMLSSFDEFSSVEIAAILKISESSARSRLFRARNLMAEKMSRVRQHPGNQHR